MGMAKNNRLFIMSNLFISVNKWSAVSLTFLYTHCSYLSPSITAPPAPSTTVTFHLAQQPHLLVSCHVCIPFFPWSCFNVKILLRLDWRLHALIHTGQDIFSVVNIFLCSCTLSLFLIASFQNKYVCIFMNRMFLNTNNWKHEENIYTCSTHL